MGNDYNCFSTTGSTFGDSESRREVITGCYIAHPNSEISELISIKALWDTGATTSCISEDLAKELDLAKGLDVQLNIAETNEVGVARHTYIADLFLAANPEYIYFDNLSMIEIPQHIRYDIIIGMDVIKQGDLALSQLSGQTIVFFRHPSKGIAMFK